MKNVLFMQIVFKIILDDVNRHYSAGVYKYPIMYKQWI